MAPEVIEEFAGNDVEGQALAGVGPKAFPDRSFAFIENPGVHSFPPEVGRHQGLSQGVPVGQHQGLVPEVVFGFRPERRVGQGGLGGKSVRPGFMVIPEGPDRRLDPGLVADAGCVIIELKDQVGLVVGRHEPLEVFQDQGVRRTLKGGEVNRIGARRPGRGVGRSEDFSGKPPVDLTEQVGEGLGRIPRRRRHHVLKKRPYPKRPEDFGNSLVQGRRADGVRPAQENHVDVIGRRFLSIDAPKALPGRLPGFHGPVISGRDLGEFDPEPRLESPVKLGLGMKSGVDEAGQGSQEPVPGVEAGNLGCQGRRVLGIVAVLPSSPALSGPLFQIMGQKDEVGPVEEMGGMAVERGHGGAELGAGMPPAGLDRVLQVLAGNRPDAEVVEKMLPEREVLGHVEARREADDRLRCPGRGRLPVLPVGREGAAAGFQEIEAGPVVVDKVPGVVIPAAEKPVSGGLPAHFGDGDLAVVGAEVADLVADGDFLAVEADPPEAGDLGRIVGHGQSRSQCPGEVTERGDVDGPLQAIFEGGHQGPVSGGGPLEEDRPADGRLGGDLGQIVFPDRMENGGQELIRRISPVQEVVEIPFHEDGASVGGQRRRVPLGSPGVVGQGAVEPPGLLLDKGPGSGGADGVHHAEGHPAVLEGRKLRVLPADLDDGVGVRPELNGGPGVSGDLVDHPVRSEDRAGELPAGARGPGPGHGERDPGPADKVVHRGQNPLGGGHRPAGGPGVKPGDHPAFPVGEDRLGAGRSHVEPQKRGHRVPGGQRLVDLHLHRQSRVGFPLGKEVGLQPAHFRVVGPRQGERGMMVGQRGVGLPAKEVIGTPQNGDIGSHAVFEETEARSECLEDRRVIVGHHGVAEERRQVLDHGPVEGHAAGHPDGRSGPPARKKGINDVPGQAEGQPVGDLREGIALLLSVDQVGLGEDRAPGGDPGDFGVVFTGDPGQLANAAQA